MKFLKLYLLLVFLPQSLLLNAGALGSFQEISGSPFAAGSAPAWSVFSPVVSGNLFVAVPNYDDATVSVYLVDQTTGALTQVSGSPFATGINPAWLAFSTEVSGNLFAAVVNYNDNTVSVYSVDLATGVFTEISGSPFATGSGPYSVSYSPVVLGNLFAAITNSFDNTVSVYSVDQTTGAFTEILGSPFATGSGPYTVSFALTSLGNLFAAITNFNDNTVSVYLVDQTTGAFTEISGSPFATGSGPYGIDYSPIVGGNLFVAVVNLNDNTVSVYSVDQSIGTFTEIIDSPFTTGTGANEIAYSPVVSGDLFAAVVNFASNNVSVYLVDQSSGSFTQVAGSPFATGAAPDGIAYSPVVEGNLFAITGNFSSNNASVFQVTTAPLAPSDIKGCKANYVFFDTRSLVNILKWKQPTMGSTPVSYYIYRDAALTDLAAIIPADEVLQFADLGRHRDIVYTYYIVSMDSNSNFSLPGIKTVTECCQCV